MATFMAGIRTAEGDFIDVACDFVRGRPDVPKPGQAIKTKGNSKSEGKTHIVDKVTRYFVLYREAGKRVQSESFKALDEVVAELRRIQVCEQSGQLIKDFRANVVEPPSDTWEHLKAEYLSDLFVRAKADEIADNGTKARYIRSIRHFSEFLASRRPPITLLSEITPKLMNQYKAYKIENGAEYGYVAELKNLRPIFNFAVEHNMTAKNPVPAASPQRTRKGTDGIVTDADRGAQPYSKDELKRMIAHLGADALCFWILFQTGLRKGDASNLRWQDVAGDYVTCIPEKTRRKNGKRVEIPIMPELKAALDKERKARYGDAAPESYAKDFVLLSPVTRKPFGRNNLYEQIRALGVRADVADATCHRFRDTFAVDCLLRGVGSEDAAEYIGDSLKTFAKHYAKYTTERRERSHEILLKGKGFLTVKAKTAA
jgi:integrase